jgi:hypothetical protein
MWVISTLSITCAILWLILGVARPFLCVKALQNTKVEEVTPEKDYYWKRRAELARWNNPVARL